MTVAMKTKNPFHNTLLNTKVTGFERPESLAQEIRKLTIVRPVKYNGDFII